MIPKQVPLSDWMGEAIKKALDQLKDEGVFEEYIQDAFSKIIIKDTEDYIKDSKEELKKEIQKLKTEKGELQLRIMNAICDSDSKPCNCSPCVVRETILEDALLNEDGSKDTDIIRLSELDKINFIDNGLYLKTENGFEEAVIYMSDDDARCFDIETSVHICRKDDFSRIEEVGETRGFTEYKVEPVLYRMDYVEEMLKWDD